MSGDVGCVVAFSAVLTHANLSVRLRLKRESTDQGLWEG